MKKKILSSITLLGGLLLIALWFNPSPEKLDSVFDIRLGMSEKEVREVVNTSLLWEYKHSYSDENNDSIANLERILSLDRYTSSDQLVLEDLTLTFFDDRLYSIKITSYNAEWESILTKKCGKPKQKRSIFAGNEYVITTWENGFEHINCVAIQYGHTYIFDLEDNEIVRESLGITSN